MANRTRYENIIIPKIKLNAKIDEMRTVISGLIKTITDLLVELKKQEEE